MKLGQVIRVESGIEPVVIGIDFKTHVPYSMEDER